MNFSVANRKQITSALLLLLASVVWGAAFVAQSIAGAEIGTYTFNGIRYMIGGVCLLPLLFKQGSSPFTADKSKLIGGVICGLALFFASTCQQAGIAAGAAAGEAGFLTACYIVIVPIIGLFLGKKCTKLIWLAVATALLGLYLLCLPDFSAQAGRFLGLSFPDVLLLACAFLFSIQILCVDHYAPIMSPVALSCVQFFVAGAVSIVAAILFEVLPDPAAWISPLTEFNNWIPILYTGIFSSAIGYTLQAVGQRNLNPTIASLIMSMESVFSTLFGWLILNQTLSLREITGCLLIFSAIILAQIPIKK